MNASIRALKNTLIALSFSGLVISCSDDTEEGDTNLVGNWRLAKVLYDPGDGSGTFQPVNSQKVVEFLSNGIVRSNGDLCNASPGSDSPSSGVFILPDSIVQIDNCPDFPLATRFSVRKNSLIISYPCIEPCQEKYIKVN